MAIDYSNAKISYQVEEQLQSFVRRDGQNFVNFVKTYYDWLERRFIICNLKAAHNISETELIGKELTLSQDFFQLESEDGLFVIVPEDFTTDYSVENIYSLSLNGINNYGDVPASLIDFSNSWTISLWLHPTENPSFNKTDFDIITLNNERYMSVLKIRKEDNYYGCNLLDDNILGEINTNININLNNWQYIAIRYDSSTKMIYYNVYSNIGDYVYYQPIDLSSLSTNRFVVGCDLYNHKNFYVGGIDEISTWNAFLSDEDLLFIYNNGSPIDLYEAYKPIANFDSRFIIMDDPFVSFDANTANTTLKNYYRFENSNASVVNNVIGLYNMNLYNNPYYSTNIPYNPISIVSETASINSLILKVISCLSYKNTQNNVVSDRILAFTEHIQGSLSSNDLENVVYTTTDLTPVILDSYIDSKNPISIINNLSNYQEIDFALNYNNYIDENVFKNFWKEVMYGFPYYFESSFDETIKDIIVKNIKDFYKSKGTLDSFKYLFKILYNEDINIYSDNTFSYVIETNNSGAQHLNDYLNKIVHPVGFKRKIIAL